MMKIWNQLVLNAQRSPEQLAIMDVSRAPDAQLTRLQLVQAVKTGL